ncbi:unnamed protein product [Blepharisma stoltei]|uniref:Uncharacterized protein n=1 Tax=Blepharisma stoltei TaxID=1481888 RepID=A0AAU9I6P5_9CILI|nr:unnamed protein product [Blepharisma stoltei]
MTDLLSNIKNEEIGIFCLLKGTKSAAECLKIEAKEVKNFLLRCDFDRIEFFSKLSGILEATIIDLGLESVADHLGVSQNLISLIPKDCPNRINIYQEYQKIVRDEISNNLDKETQYPDFLVINKKNEQRSSKELDLLGEGIMKKRSRPKSSKSVTSNPEKEPIKRPKNIEFNKSITPPSQNNPLDLSMPILNPPIETPIATNTSPIYNETLLNADQNETLNTNNSSQDQVLRSAQNLAMSTVQNPTMNPLQIPNIFSPNMMFHPTLLNKYGPFGFPQPLYPTNNSQSQDLMTFPAFSPSAIMTLSNQLMAGTMPIQAPVQRPNPSSRSHHQTQATCTNWLLKYNIPYHTPPNGNILDPDYSYRPKPA